MGGTTAIDYNIRALKRILVTIVAMAGGAGLASRSGATTLPRRLRLAVLSLLRPAESAARRLIVAMAHGIAVTLSPPRPRKIKREAGVSPTIVRNGTGIVPPSGAAPVAAPAHLIASAAGRPPVFPLVDPPRRWRGGRGRPAGLGIPRICVPGVTERLPVPRPPAPDDPVDAARLLRRLEALASALDDLPGQARRFARWRARRERSMGRGGGRRRSPLRPGRPPGGRLSRYDPAAPRPRRVREVDEVLAHAHALAVYALDFPDTS